MNQLLGSKRVEILAPAGSPDALLAAVESGANAVYLGLKCFNARGNAINFTREELAHYVPLAHEAGVRSYLTLNTLVKMIEMEPILDALALAVEVGIDGVILQDIGLGRVIARYFPQLRRHASTQMAIHNLEGVQFCVDEGYQRVVLARELTLKEICEIRAAFPAEQIQLEVFCHGAMCYAYSGLCFFSGSVGGRSGNRGECAYTCRKGYRIHNQTTYPMAPQPLTLHNYLFSMKDMNTLEILPQLLEAGIDSLKIEGRRKGPAYVSASVLAYREGLAGHASADRKRDLSLSFARSYSQAFYQRSQFGDAPIDLTATGSIGIHIGDLDGKGYFELLKAGIQRYDGIRLVLPDRSETTQPFKDYFCEADDRSRPALGSQIKLKGSYPAGTQVRWVFSQDVEQRYRPAKQLPAQNKRGGPVDIHVHYQHGQLRIRVACPYAEVKHDITVPDSHSGKRAPLRKVLFRFGDSEFLEGSWYGPQEIDGFVRPSQLKKLRRTLLTELAQRSRDGRAQAIRERVTEAKRCKPVPPRQTAKANFILRLDSLDLLEAVLPWANEQGMGIDFVPKTTLSTPHWRSVIELLQTVTGPLRLALPMVLRQWDLRLLRRRLASSKDLFQEVVLANPSHFPLVEQILGSTTRHADFSIYHLNSWATEALEQRGINGRFSLSLEDDKPNMEALLRTLDPARFEVIAYMNTPLFVGEACTLAALYGGCPGSKVCKYETLQIENEHGDRFQVRHDRCRSTVIDERALSWTGQLGWFKQRGVHHFRADFTSRDYRPQEVSRIMEALQTDQPLEGTHSENLERTLL